MRACPATSTTERVASVKCFSMEVVCQTETISYRTMRVRGDASANVENIISIIRQIGYCMNTLLGMVYF